MPLKIAIIKMIRDSATLKYSEDWSWLYSTVSASLRKRLEDKSGIIYRKHSTESVLKELRESFRKAEVELRKKTTTIL